MQWLNLPRVDEPELIDNPDQPPAAIDASMADLARVNRWFGGVDAVVGAVAAMSYRKPNRVGMPIQGYRHGTRKAVERLLRLRRNLTLTLSLERRGNQTVLGDRRLRILDLGTGSGDIPRALVRWAKANAVDVHVVAVDNLPGMLRIARDRTDPKAPIDYIQADALALPFPPASFDIVTCNLMLHHLGVDAAARVLAQMDELSTVGFVATDLRRDRLSLALVSTGLGLLRAHPITRHDGPASVRRAFTRREYEQIVALSGVRGVRMMSSWYYRVVLVSIKEMGGTPI